MLFGVGVSCILCSIVSYLYVSCRKSITSVGEETQRANFSAIILFLFGGVFSFSWCLGWAVLFYCGSP